jgi:tetraacyldisaccharide 4'-kinase
VGNITVGGTGKSACVLWLAHAIHQRGIKVAILSRGYHRSRTNTTGATGLLDTAALPLGDEPAMFREQLPDVPVFVGRDRVQSAQRAVTEAQADIILLDDGFQHRRLGRTCDIVTVDAVDAWGNGRLFPRGPLREWPRALARAHCVIFTKTNLVSRVRHELIEQIRLCNPDALIVNARHAVSGVYDVAADQCIDVTCLQGARVLALSSIGSPTSFEQLIIHANATVSIAARFPDHHPYQLGELQQLLQRCATAGVSTIITTHKDWMRIAHLRQQLPTHQITWYVLRIHFEVDTPDAVVDRLLQLSRR